MQQPPMQINPIAIIAAIVYNMHKTEQLEVEDFDGSGKELIDIPVITIEQEGDSCICVMPMTLLEHFQSVPHDVAFGVQEGNLLIRFSKAQANITLLAANGQKVVSPSQAEEINKLMERVK